ncbi:MAG: hypothetical protein HRU80_06250 [Ignavibacteriales bacterium]|nr:MAG: hypothetical protein HRU80_06250 [Ignavibacteriales bacterium]
MNDLNSKLLLNVTLPGMIAGILELTGYFDDFIWLFWIAYWVFAGYVISRRLKKGQFLHGMIAGAGAYALAVAIKLLGYEMYIENSSAAMALISALPEDVNPRIYIASMGLIVSVISGTVTGFLTLAVSKLKG